MADIRAVRAAVEAFPATDSMVSVWERYPDVSAEEDAATDRWACQQASKQFAAFLAGGGIVGRLVFAENPDVPFHDQHWWVRVECVDGVVNVDWTARQFYNLDYPYNPRHANLPCPMIWQTGDEFPADTHPVTGKYHDVSETQIPAEKGSANR